MELSSSHRRSHRDPCPSALTTAAAAAANETNILLVGPRQLTEPFAAALLRVVAEGDDDDVDPWAAATVCHRVADNDSDPVDVFAVQALQRWLPQPQPPPLSLLHRRPSAPSPPILRLHTQELPHAIAAATAAPPPHWDQIVWLTSVYERDFTHRKIWDQEETQAFLGSGIASHVDVVRQRVAIVVVLLHCDQQAPKEGNNSSVSSALGGVLRDKNEEVTDVSTDPHTKDQPQQQQQHQHDDDHGMHDIPQPSPPLPPEMNQEQTPESSVSEGPKTAAAAAADDDDASSEQPSPALLRGRRRRRRRDHYNPLRTLKPPIFCCSGWPPDSASSMQSAARFVWKQCCCSGWTTAQQQQQRRSISSNSSKGGSCSPLVLLTSTQFQQPPPPPLVVRKRKAAAAAVGS
jgi:hypothetical protein